MNFNKSEMLDIVRRQLAVDMNCKEEGFLHDNVIFCEAKEKEGYFSKISSDTLPFCL